MPVLSSPALKLILLSLLLALAGCREQIIHDLSEGDANRLMTRLNTAGIEAEKVRQADTGWALSVSSSNARQAIGYLIDSRAMRRPGRADDEKPSLVSSREEQRFRYERSVSRELEGTLAGIEGVLEARVHLNLPLADPLFGSVAGLAGGGTASVLLVTSGELRLSKEEVAALVAQAVGIESQKVAVLVSAGAGTEEVPQNIVDKAAAASAEPQALADSQPADLQISALKTALTGLFGDVQVGPVQWLAAILFLLGASVIMWGFRRRLGLSTTRSIEAGEI